MSGPFIEWNHPFVRLNSINKSLVFSGHVHFNSVSLFMKTAWITNIDLL